MFHWIADPAAWIGVLTLTVLEIVLGIDNIVFLSILTSKLAPEQRPKARKIGLGLALVARVLLILSITWVIGLVYPVFTLPIPGLAKEASEISWRDIILLVGGLFLVYKSVKEIHEKLEGDEHHDGQSKAATFGAVLVQIVIIDLVFSLDSVITAVGMIPPDQVGVMITAVMISILFMLGFAGPIAKFVEQHPTVKMLALSFLILIGVNLLAEGFGQHIPKGYTYFAMAFAVLVEMLNLRLRKHHDEPVHLRQKEL